MACLLNLHQTETDSVEDSYYLYLIRTFTNAINRKDFSRVEKLYKENPLLMKSIGISKKLKHVPRTKYSDHKKRNEYRNEVVELILSYACNKIKDKNTLLFIAAAKFEPSKLQEVVKDVEDINTSNFCDTPIIFALKYGNTLSKRFLESTKILIAAGGDVNRFDSEGRTAMDFIAALYSENNADELKTVAELLVPKIYQPFDFNSRRFLTTVLNLDVESLPLLPVDDKTKLFRWMRENNISEFISFENIKELANTDDGNNTLLQLACQKTDEALPMVQHLLENGADPNQTGVNNLSPVELAGYCNNGKIFEEVLSCDNITISLEQYRNLLKWRFKPMKKELFDLLLVSKKLNQEFKCEGGNTPLHCAIVFSDKDVIRLLLTRHPRLLDTNNTGKSVLDIIDPDDLAEYFDYCLDFNKSNCHFNDINFHMKFCFQSLVNMSGDDTIPREVRVVSKIGQHANLENLLTHPLVQTFISLKWFKVRFFFWILFGLQTCIFALLFVLFYFLSDGSFVYYLWIFVPTALNIAIKVPIFLNFRMRDNRPDFFVLKRAVLHGSLEILLMATTIGSLFYKQFRAFLFVEISILFLLTAGYHPRLSKWSIMLQKVFRTFTVLLTFFSLIIIAFGIGLQILFPEDTFFQNIPTSIFRTYIMTTGEFNLEDPSLFKSSGFGGYLLFLFFAMSMAMVLVNFWTGVAVSDIDRIEKNSEVNATKNVIELMSFINFIYTKFAKRCRWVQNYRSPLLFLRFQKDYKLVKVEKVDFYPNRDEQFRLEGFPARLDDGCLNSLRNYYYRRRRMTRERKILNELAGVKKTLEEMKTKCLCKNEIKL